MNTVVQKHNTEGSSDDEKMIPHTCVQQVYKAQNDLGAGQTAICISSLVI
jgi:hypothetical protein